MPEFNGNDYLNDEEIGDGVVLYRRVWPSAIANKYTPTRPASGFFNNSRDHSGTSFFIFETDDEALQLLEGSYQSYGLIALTAGQIRETGLGVKKVPTDEDNDPETRNHVQIQGEKTKERKYALANKARWVFLP